MKLNGNIILSLVDFRRAFDLKKLNEFWKARHQFVRDMDPEIIHYWDNEDVRAFHDVVRWFNAEDAGSASYIDRIKGIRALSKLAGLKSSIDVSTFETYRKGYLNDIIYANEPELHLPGSLVLEPNVQPDNEQEEILHKIEVDKTATSSTVVFIGYKEAWTIEPGKCVYVTEIGGQFQRVLPTEDHNELFDCILENIPGHFESNFIVVNWTYGMQKSKKYGYTHFTLNPTRFFSGKKYLSNQ